MTNESARGKLDNSADVDLNAQASVEIDTAVYPLTDIARAAYSFTDQWWIQIERTGETCVEVRIRSKTGAVAAEVLRGEFSNALLDQAVRRTVADETHVIRETLIRTALAAVRPRAMTDKAAQERGES